MAKIEYNPTSTFTFKKLHQLFLKEEKKLLEEQEKSVAKKEFTISMNELDKLQKGDIDLVPILRAKGFSLDWDTEKKKITSPKGCNFYWRDNVNGMWTRTFYQEYKSTVEEDPIPSSPYKPTSTPTSPPISETCTSKCPACGSFRCCFITHGSSDEEDFMKALIPEGSTFHKCSFGHGWLEDKYGQITEIGPLQQKVQNQFKEQVKKNSDSITLWGQSRPIATISKPGSKQDIPFDDSILNVKRSVKLSDEEQT
jgi:hypothetical protein